MVQFQVILHRNLALTNYSPKIDCYLSGDVNKGRSDSKGELIELIGESH